MRPGKQRRRVVLERKYGEEERRRPAASDTSMTRAEFSDRAEDGVFVFGGVDLTAKGVGGVLHGNGGDGV